MPTPHDPQLFRTSSLRRPRFGNYDPPDYVITEPQGRRPRADKVVGRPRSSWADDYDTTGRFYSRRAWYRIKGSHKRVKLYQNGRERKFRYRPDIPWHDNPAYWDEQDVVIELIK